MKEKQNNYAFIDSQNLNLSIKSLGWKINFYAFRHYLQNRYNIERAFLFFGEIQNQQTMYNSLKKAGFEIIFKKVIERDKKTKGNIDIDMAIWTMHYLYNVKETFDKAMLITGDGDFYSLADYLKERDKLLTIGIPNRDMYSILLRKFDKFFISDWRTKIEFKKRKK